MTAPSDPVDGPRPELVEGPLDPEDRKILTLARAARARTAARQGACVRDTDGRTYAGTSVDLPHLRLSAMQVAVAMAVSSGAAGLEAAVLVGEPNGHDFGALGDLAGLSASSGRVQVWWADESGTAIGRTTLDAAP